MSNNKVQAQALVNGQGALTASEAAALVSEYRTADRAEALASMRRGRIVYVLAERGMMDGDGNTVTFKDFARNNGITGAAVSQYRVQYATVVALGLQGESDPVQRDAFRAAVRLRKLTPGRDKSAQASFADDVAACLRDIATLPVGERVAALDDATAKDTGALWTLAKEYRNGGAGEESADAGTREASETPQTSGERAAAGKANVLDSLDALLDAVADESVALTNSDADRAARLVGTLSAMLGLNVETVREYHDATVAEFAAYA